MTYEAVQAMRQADYFVVTDKPKPDGAADPLVAARERMLARHLDHEPRLVVVEDPARDRTASGTATRADYETAVADWHEARAAAYEQVLRDHDGDAGFLVWGDPAFYDSTLRVLEKVRTRLEFDLDVIPGISSIQLLAARHRIVLHDVGRPIHVTTGRALAEAIAEGQDNVVVMLNRGLDPLHDPGARRLADLVGSQPRHRGRSAGRGPRRGRGRRDRPRASYDERKRGVADGHLPAPACDLKHTKGLVPRCRRRGRTNNRVTGTDCCSCAYAEGSRRRLKAH